MTSPVTVASATSMLLPSVRPMVMGILNVTPDSFSDGGRYLDQEAAVAHGLSMFTMGADVVDVGGESSRPGAEPVHLDEELRRVVPVIEALVAAGAGRVSIDTVKPAVAEAAIAAGARLVNDISAALLDVVVSCGRPDVGWITMHMRGVPPTMQNAPRYDDVVDEVTDFLEAKATAAVEAGIAEVWVDPGIGFGKSEAHNLLLLRHLSRLTDLGYPVLVGTSRKRFLGAILARSDQAVAAVAAGAAGAADKVDSLEVAVDDRDAGTIGTEVWAMAMGARMVRTHDVQTAVQSSRLVWADPRVVVPPER